MIFEVMEKNNGGDFVIIGEKELYNLDGIQSASKWVRCEEKLTIEMPNFSSALKVKEAGSNKSCVNMVGHCYMNTNNVQTNQLIVSIFSAPFGGPGDFCVTTSNFNRAIALFAARKLIQQNWLNDNDEYMVPNISHPAYQQFVNDAVVFSLFHSASNQSSLRGITYKGT